MENTRYVDNVTQRCFTFLHAMFTTRKYRIQPQNTTYVRNGRVWILHGTDLSTNTQIVCILIPHLPFDYIGLVPQCHRVTVGKVIDILPCLSAGYHAKTDKWSLGTNAMKTLRQYQLSTDASRIIVVSDHVTSPGRNYIATNQACCVDVFTYRDAIMTSMFSHVFQPLFYRVIRKCEIDSIKQLHPDFKKEFQRMVTNDPLVRFLGLYEGDILEYNLTDPENNERTREYALIRKE